MRYCTVEAFRRWDIGNRQNM